MIEKMLSDPTIVISLISLFIALVSVIQTNKQIRLSNKHQLLNKRIDVYMIIVDLMDTCSHLKPNIKYYKSPTCFEKLMLDYIALTSSHYLSTIQNINVLADNTNYQKLIMEKLDELNLDKQRMKFIFPKKETKLFETFFDCFIDLIWKYMYLFNKFREGSISMDLIEKIDLCTSHKKLEKSYDNILEQKAMKKLERIINIQY